MGEIRGDYVFVVQMSAVLRYIYFYLELNIHEIRVAKLSVLAKVLDFIRASQQFCLGD